MDKLYCLYITPWASAWGVFAFQSGPYAHGVQVSSGLRPHARAGDFKFFQVFAPLWGPLRGDFRAFPAGVILSPLCL